jgi:hypothetical protein
LVLCEETTKRRRDTMVEGRGLEAKGNAPHTCLTRLLYSLCKETHGGLLEIDGRKVGVKRCTGLVARVGDH